MLTDFSVMIRFAASTPYSAKTARGEPSGAMRWMISIIAWTQTTLKSRFKFWTKPLLSVQASDASDLLMVRYLLELLCDRSPFGATMQIRRPLSTGSPHTLAPISG
jgi:hypothetical protein